MLSKKIQAALAGSSAIRAMFVEGKELAEKVGAENVLISALEIRLHHRQNLLIRQLKS